MDYRHKYLKYKTKYNILKNQMPNRLKSIEDELETYLIHDNRDRPFKVEIYNSHDNDTTKTVRIYKLTGYSQNDEPLYAGKPLEVFKTDKVFVGISPRNKMTEFSAGYGPQFNGNTIVIHLADNRYVFIGGEIFIFSTYTPIITYSSPVGNNDVPYPYAIDMDGNYYLLIENVILRHTEDLSKKIQEYDNPYDYYYKYYIIVSHDENKHTPRLMNITEFYIGDDRYDLGYKPYPDEDYDRIVRQWRDEALYVTYGNGKRTVLTKEEYIDIMKEFGSLLSFEPLTKTILHHRDM